MLVPAPEKDEVSILVGWVEGCHAVHVTASRDRIELLVVANDEFARRLRLVGPG
jgi:hypothetical protein